MSDTIKVGQDVNPEQRTENLASLSMRDGAEDVMHRFGADVFGKHPVFASTVLAAYMTTEATFAMARELGRLADSINTIALKPTPK